MSLLDRTSSTDEREDPKVPDSGLTVRTYKSCTGCRARKVRCIVEDRAAGASCIQCLKDGQTCVFEAKKRSYDTSTRTRKAREKRARLEAPTPDTTAENLSHEHFNVRSSADALLFLSDAAARHGSEVELSSGHVEPVQHSVSPTASYNGRESGIPGLKDIEEERARLESPVSPCENADTQDTIAAFRCRLFWDNIVTPSEALAYVCFFFRDLYPFFPFVPDAYYTCLTRPNPDPQVMRCLFEEEDILLGCVITVSSRYYHLQKRTVGGYERSREIHNSSWLWTRRQVARVVFEGVRPKSPLSVVETLLMLAEWLPRPIHAFVENSTPSRSASSSRRAGELLLQPAFRTDQVSWSYVGNAFLLLRSLSPSRRICPILKTSSRYLTTLFGCLIMSQSLARRLGRPALMSFEDVDLTQVSQAFHERNIRLYRSQESDKNIPNLSLGVSDQFQSAFVELMKLLAHSQDVLHPPTQDGIIEPKGDASQTNQRLLALLQHFDMMNQNWKAQYESLWELNAPGMSEFSRTMLRIDFEYLRLYEFSMSLGTYLKLAEGGKDTTFLSGRSAVEEQENDWEFPPTSLAYYIEQAIGAAETLLRLMLHFHSPSGKNTLRYASSRYYMKIVFASVFLIQALRSGIPSVSYQTDLIATLKDTVTVLRRCSIDAAHPALRYSILLRGLMKDLEPSRSPEVSSLIALKIGPRQAQSMIPDEGARSGPYPLGNEASQTQFQTYSTSSAPLPSAGASQWPSSTAYPEANQWSGFDSSIIEWEDSMTQLDTDTFLQSLMGVDIFPTM
ncbi:Zn(2)-C6 fungal-type domain-containing protein [Fusarium sp. LHS14.1]|nr:Zn(2)-C6 fungal-type domain-containing protein [Fusarium sp. LHS14.1]